MKMYPFSALLSRMKYITRWGLMHAGRTETLSEHTAETAQLAHLLCLLSKEKFGRPVRPERVAAAALYHDASEIVTGDLPTPVKYHNRALAGAYKDLEREAQLSYWPMLPAEVRGEMACLLTEEDLTELEKKLLKAADKLSALIKCVEEEQSGNREFLSAKSAQLSALRAMELPEVTFFLSQMLPCYTETLDSLMSRADEKAF